MSFRAEIEGGGTAVTLHLSGDLTATSDTELLGAHAAAVEGDPRTLTLDFSAVDYINSSGIALIVTVLTEARAAQRTVCAVGLSAHYRHIFEITRLSDYLTFDDDAGAQADDDAPQTAARGAGRA